MQAERAYQEPIRIRLCHSDISYTGRQPPEPVICWCRHRPHRHRSEGSGEPSRVAFRSMATCLLLFFFKRGCACSYQTYFCTINWRKWSTEASSATCGVMYPTLLPSRSYVPLVCSRSNCVRFTPQDSISCIWHLGLQNLGAICQSPRACNRYRCPERVLLRRSLQASQSSCRRHQNTVLSGHGAGRPQPQPERFSRHRQICLRRVSSGVEPDAFCAHNPKAKRLQSVIALWTGIHSART